MNRALTLLAAIGLSLQAIASTPQMTWLDTMHDFGAFNEELGLVNCTFKAVNTGTEPVTVISARANCGCTKPRYTNEPVAPGDTLTLSVAYDATGRPGRFEKKVYVSTSDGIQQSLRIRGTVIGASNSIKGRYPVEAGPMRLNTTVMPFGEVMKGHTAGSVVRAYNHTSDTIRPEVVDCPSYITLLFQPQAVPPGEQFVLSATASSAKTPEWGYLTDTITIRPDKGSDLTLPLSTVLIVREDFSKLTPEQMQKAPVADYSTKLIDLGRISRDSKPVERTFTITNSGEQQLLVRRADTPDPAVKVSLSSDKIKKGKSATVTVRIDPSKIGDTELLNARITIITNDPKRPQNIVRVVGQP